MLQSFPQSGTSGLIVGRAILPAAAFQAASCLSQAPKSRLKAGCSQDCLPHNFCGPRVQENLCGNGQPCLQAGFPAVLPASAFCVAGNHACRPAFSRPFSIRVESLELQHRPLAANEEGRAEAQGALCGGLKPAPGRLPVAHRESPNSRGGLKGRPHGRKPRAACTACGARWHLAAGCHPAFAGFHPPLRREAPCGQPGLTATQCAARKLSALSFQLSARGRSPFLPAWRALGQNRRGAQRFSGLVIQKGARP
jgi:hypothetical protein